MCFIGFSCFGRNFDYIWLDLVYFRRNLRVFSAFLLYFSYFWVILLNLVCFLLDFMLDFAGFIVFCLLLMYFGWNLRVLVCFYYILGNFVWFYWILYGFDVFNYWILWDLLDFFKFWCILSEIYVFLVYFYYILDNLG